MLVFLQMEEIYMYCLFATVNSLRTFSSKFGGLKNQWIVFWMKKLSQIAMSSTCIRIAPQFCSALWNGLIYMELVDQSTLVYMLRIGNIFTSPFQFNQDTLSFYLFESSLWQRNVSQLTSDIAQPVKRIQRTERVCKLKLLLHRLIIITFPQNFPSKRKFICLFLATNSFFRHEILQASLFYCLLQPDWKSLNSEKYTLASGTTLKFLLAQPHVY